MNMKKILLAVLALAVFGGGAYWYASMGESGAQTPEGKLKTANFSGRLEEVNTGCFSDGECFVVVDGKHVTTLLGWSQKTVGSIQGVDSMGDLEKFVGHEVEVYAEDKGDGTYTLYGSKAFYVKLAANAASATASVTLTGKQTCLSHRNKTGPQTLECALGFRTDDGKEYSLDLNLSSSTDAASIISSGERVSVQGIITPAEALNTDIWQKYDMLGILSVTSATRI